jgi:hypothetical protein
MKFLFFLFFRPFGLCPFRALLDQKPYNRRLDENLMNTGAQAELEEKP